MTEFVGTPLPTQIQTFLILSWAGISVLQDVSAVQKGLQRLQNRRGNVRECDDRQRDSNYETNLPGHDLIWLDLT